MQHKNFIRTSTIEDVKKQIEKLCEQNVSIVVNIKKSRSKAESHSVQIAGTYAKFFTVRNNENRLYFTVQYVDIVMGNVSVSW